MTLSEVEAVCRMEENFNTVEFQELLVSQTSCVCKGVIMLKKHTLFADQGWVVPLQQSIDLFKLLTIEFSIHGTTIRYQHKVKSSLKVSPHANYHFGLKSFLDDRFRGHVWKGPYFLVCIVKTNPLFIFRHDSPCHGDRPVTFCKYGDDVWLEEMTIHGELVDTVC